MRKEGELSGAEYEARCAEMAKRLRPKLTGEFLETLVLSAKICGWGVPDYGEVMNFVEWCFAVAEVEMPDLQPFIQF